MKINEQAFNDYNELLKPFDAIDIKYTSEDETDDGLQFIANIKNNDGKYDNIYNDIIKEYEKSEFDEYINYTNYGYITINNESDQITIEVFVEDDELDNVDELDETVTLKEGGIYPVMIEDAAKDALKELIDSIIGGDNDIGELELLPALGSGGAGRYWYKTTITLSEETIIDYITEEDTPEAYRLMNNGDLVINSYSDIDITCSADSDSYHDGVTLDAMDYSNADMTKLIKESNFIGSIIIKQLFEKESEIIAKLQEYEIPEDEELNESKSPKKENYDNPKMQTMIDNIKNWTEYDVKIEVTHEDHDYATIKVYMPETNEYIGEWELDITKAENQDYAGSIADEINAVEVVSSYIEENIIPIKKLKEGWQDDWTEPVIEKEPIEKYGLFNIYKGTNHYGEEAYYVFFKDEDPEPGYEEWEAETIEIAKEWCDSYEDPDDEIYIDDDPNVLDEIEFEFDESLIPIQEESDETEYYQRNIYDVLDNITALADSYDDAENDEKLKKLGKTIRHIEDELDTLKKVYMKAIVGIKEIQL